MFTYKKCLLVDSQEEDKDEFADLVVDKFSSLINEHSSIWTPENHSALMILICNLGFPPICPNNLTLILYCSALFLNQTL